MNALKSLLYIPSRAYVRRIKNVGIESKLRVGQKSALNIDVEELNVNDLDEFEAEYMNVGEFYDIHKREEKFSKELLKNRIVAGKYFKKDKDPNFLTTVEKEEIRKLHESNSEEWTVERLSESFPALPETIKKILKSKWPLTSVDQVMKYDATVIQNWKLFKKGKIAVDPLLREHLEKFKDRTVTMLDRELAKSLVPPKPELPKPKSVFFSSIIESHLQKEESNRCNTKALPDGEQTNAMTDISRNIPDKKISLKTELSDENDKSKSKNKGKVIFNEFIKQELMRMYKESPEKAITLLDVYKQQLKAQDTVPKGAQIASKKETLNSLEKDSSSQLVSEKETDSVLQDSVKTDTDSQLVTVEKSDTDSQVIMVNDTENNLDTYVKARISKITQAEYALPIKIPKNLYEENKTYRICDCYYDSNGQFLYRVPGVFN